MGLIQDNQDEILRLLKQIESNTAASGGNTIINNQRTDTPNDDNTPTYFTTGSDRLRVERTESWARIDLEIVASTINIRTTDDIEVAFANPNKRAPAITVRNNENINESPFTIGTGGASINTAFVWVRKADTATENPEIEIIAYK